MAIYHTLNWQNENALSSYPFDEDIFSTDFIVDAKFIQFDGFIPILNSVIVDADKIILSVTFDYGTNEIITYLKSDFLNSVLKKHLRIYTPDNSRYLGVLVFGEGLAVLWNTAVGRKYVVNRSFSVAAIINIPKNAGVYTLDGLYGAVNLSRTAEDKTIFYNTSNTNNTITFNAVANHEVVDTSSVLKKINLVSPVDNNINLASNDVIKIYSEDNVNLKISLASGEASKSFIIPTLIA